MPDTPTKTLRIRQGELSSIQFVCGLLSEMERSKETLKARYEVTGDTETVGEVVQTMSGIVERLLTTIEPQKLMTLRSNMRVQQMKIVTGKDAVEDGHTVISTDNLSTLLQAASAEKCALCLGGADEMRQCPLRKTLKQICMCDMDEGAICTYRDVEW